jgi:hypothetical protein
MEYFRELARAIALRDFDGATIILDLMVRDDVLVDMTDESESISKQVGLGRSDAAAVRARDGKVAVLKAA